MNKHKNLVEKFIFLFMICLFMGFSSHSFGQVKPLDNWDLEVVDKKDLQSETYFSFSKRGPYNTTGVKTLLRYGIQRNFELQVDWTGSKTETFFGDESSQVANVGVKAFLADESKYLPGISLIGSINLTADPEKNPISPALNVLLRKGISKNFALTGNFKLILDEQSGDFTNDFALNLDVELTDWLTTYLGIKGVKSNSLKDTNPLYQEYVELGMLFWIADRYRLYPIFDFGLGDDSDDIISLGFIYLFK